MIVIILATLRRTRGTARILQGYLLLYGLYVASVGVTAWLARPGGALDNDVFITVLSIGTPTGMIGSGILTLLIVSADLALHLRETVGARGLAGRLGGEEFVLLLPGFGTDAAYSLVDAPRAGVPARFSSSQPALEQVSASFGIALVQSGQSWSAALVRADAALHRAEHAGRNRVLVDEETA